MTDALLLAVAAATGAAVMIVELMAVRLLAPWFGQTLPVWTNVIGVVLLAYPNEGHGLRGMANRKDLTIRYFQFFDHYLKGAPAPKWMTEGVPFLQKNAGR